MKERKLRLKRVKGDVQLFAETYLPHYLDCPPSPFHRELYQVIQHAKEGKRMIRAAPRGHGKSTLISLILPLWCICCQKKRFILMVSDTLAQARLFLEGIVAELEGNRQLREDFGNLIGKKRWTGTEILTTTTIRVMARGTGSRLRGLRSFEVRPDLVICDDLENDELVRTAEQRKKIHQWFTKALMNTMDPGGDLFVVGTIIHYDSLLAKLLKVPGWNGKTYRALLPEGEVLWAAKWSRQRLEERRREIGTLAFNSEFQNDPADPHTRIFQPEWFRFYSSKDIEGVPLDIYSGVDPALSQKETADYSAIVTIGIDPNGMIYVLDADICRLTPKELISRIFRKFLTYKHLLIGVETVAFQEVLKEWLDELSREKGVYLPTREIKHRSDKVRRLTRLSPLFEKGFIHLRRDQELLMEQLEHFPLADHDDGPDALEMAVDMARKGVLPFEHIQQPKRIGEFWI